MKHIFANIITLVKTALLVKTQDFVFVTLYRDGVHYSQGGEGCCGGGCGDCGDGCQCG